MEGVAVFGCSYPALCFWSSSRDISYHGHAAGSVKGLLPRPLGGISEAREKAPGRGLHSSNQQLLQVRGVVDIQAHCALLDTQELGEKLEARVRQGVSEAYFMFIINGGGGVGMQKGCSSRREVLGQSNKSMS